MHDVTTIRLSKDTRDNLAKLGSKDDTFDSIVRKLIEQVEP
jgi:hypothetical protein